MRQDFRPIPGTDGYQINTEGVVLSRGGRRIATSIASQYEVCKIKLSTGKRGTVLIHRAVWKAHVEDIPKTLWVNHKDGDKLNNKLENLEAGTPTYNHQHARDVLKRNYVKGEQTGTAQLNDAAIEAIRLLNQAGMSQSMIAKAFLVSQCTISNILRRKTWNCI